MSKKKKKTETPVELTPPDVSRCQAEKPNGHNFMTLGGKPGMVRCSNSPVVIATETKPGLDGQIGAMSLCDGCWEVFQKQMPPGFATFERIKHEEMKGS